MDARHTPSHDSPTATRSYLLGRELQATVLTTGAETDGRHDIIDATLAPGSRTPVHLHSRYEERVYLLSGALTVWIGAQRLDLAPGDFYTVPLDTPHAVQAGPDGGRSLIVSSPAGFADLIARAGTPTQDAPTEPEFDQETFVAISTELGDAILAPPGATPADLPGAQPT